MKEKKKQQQQRHSNSIARVQNFYENWANRTQKQTVNKIQIFQSCIIFIAAYFSLGVFIWFFYLSHFLCVFFSLSVITFFHGIIFFFRFFSTDLVVCLFDFLLVSNI